jgi:PAS domain S-box-containing protein
MVVFAEEILKTGKEQVTYQKILENLLFISKAKYGVLTLKSDITDKFTTVAVAGLNNKVKKLSKMLGFELVGKEWNEYSTENEMLNGKIVARFSSVSELAERVIPKIITNPIEKLFNMGETIVTKIIVNSEIVGDFTLIMPHGQKFEKDSFVEIYSRQIDMFITRIKAEEKLKESEEKYRLLTENTLDVIWVLNLSLGKFTYISPSVFLLRGLTAAEAMNESLEEAVTPESLVIINDVIARELDNFIKNPQAPNYFLTEVRQPCKNGDIIWVEVSTQCRYTATGDIEVVGVSRIIEERKKAEAEIRWGSRGMQSLSYQG